MVGEMPTGIAIGLIFSVGSRTLNPLPTSPSRTPLMSTLSTTNPHTPPLESRICWTAAHDSADGSTLRLILITGNLGDARICRLVVLSSRVPCTG
jgi:hypothetical protein